MAWTYLLIASGFENEFGLGLTYTEGFTRLVPSVRTVAAGVTSFLTLSQPLKTLPVGTGYAMWTVIGAVGAAPHGILLLDKPRDAACGRTNGGILRRRWLTTVVGCKAGSGRFASASQGGETMSNITQTEVGAVVALWRYPVKSMMGEELNAADVTERGLLGDRAYALFDASNGKVASAKNPRKWAKLFDVRAAFVEPPCAGEEIPPVRFALPDGTMVTSEGSDLNGRLSNVLGREVMLATTASMTLRFEQYWPDDIEGLTHRDAVTEYTMPAGTFFDSAVLHLLTTATIDRLRELYPAGRFEIRRFRPNIVVQPASSEKRFLENTWIGHTLAIGDEVQLRVTDLCRRCVMTTLPQGDLPEDPGVLRTAAQYNQASVGVYAEVLRGGMIRRGDPIRLE